VNSKLIWTDIETTGTNPARDSIIEISVFTAPFFDATNLKHCFTYIMAPENDPYRDWDPAVLKMHKDSGLLAQCMDPTMVTPMKDVKREFIDVVLEAWLGREKPILAGSSVHFDKAFLEKHMPRCSEFLHYRILDVTSIKLDAMSMGMPEIKKAEAHRTHDDVLESVEHLRQTRAWYRDHQ